MPCNVGKLILLLNTSNYSTISWFDEREYKEAILIYENITNIEIWDVTIDDKWSQEEINFYQWIWEKNKFLTEHQYGGFLMIIPVKSKVPCIKSTFSYDFEVAVLDFKQRYEYNSNYLLLKLIRLWTNKMLVYY